MAGADHTPAQGIIGPGEQVRILATHFACAVCMGRYMTTPKVFHASSIDMNGAVVLGSDCIQSSLD